MQKFESKKLDMVLDVNAHNEKPRKIRKVGDKWLVPVYKGNKYIKGVLNGGKNIKSI